MHGDKYLVFCRGWFEVLPTVISLWERHIAVSHLGSGIEIFTNFFPGLWLGLSLVYGGTEEDSLSVIVEKLLIGGVCVAWST